MSNQEELTELIKSMIKTKKRIEKSSEEKNYTVETEIRFGKIEPHIFDSIYTDPKEYNTTEKLYEIKNKKNVTLKSITNNNESIQKDTSVKNTYFLLKEEISSDYIIFSQNNKTKPAKITLSIERKRNYNDITNNKIYLLTRHKYRKSKQLPGYKIDKTKITDENKKTTYELELEITDNNINIEKLIKTATELQNLIEQHISIKKLITTITQNINIDTYKINKPVDINIRNIRYNFKQGGSIGYKLDGIRKFVAIIGKNIYTISTSGNETIIHEDNYNTTLITLKNKNSLSLYDSEEVENQYHIFDTIIHLGKDVTKEKLTKRLSYIPKMCIQFNTELKKQLFIVKPHFIFKDFNGFKELNRIIINKMKNFECDGIIYTTLNEYLNTVFKWKHIKTIDFALTENSLKLFNKGKLVDSNFILQKTEKKIPEKSHIIECYIEKPKSKNDTGKAFYIRPRPDKKFPNTYEMLKKSLTNIGDEENILNSFLGKNVYFLRSYHNDIKRELLKKGSENLLDIGTGRGGDISKWGHYKKVFCIEPNEENITELTKRLESRNTKTPEIKILKTKIEDIYKNFAETSKENITTISAMFSLTLVDTEKLIKIIDKISSEKCIFICTVMSKKYVQQFFKNIDKDKFTCEPYTMLLRKNDITINIKDTMVKKQTEKLFDTDKFIEEMEKINFIIQERKRLIEEPFMSDSEYILSSMYESLTFNKNK